MPAVTPADVQTAPSRTKIGSDSTCTAGKRRANSVQNDQWVAARRPSSTPVEASRNAPVQTEATRRAFLARRRTQSTRAASAAAASTPGPPTIRSVSSAAPGRGSSCVVSPSPAEADTRRPPAPPPSGHRVARHPHRPRRRWLTRTPGAGPRRRGVAPRGRRAARRCGPLAGNEGPLAFPPEPARLRSACPPPSPETNMIAHDTPLQIGSLLFEGIDQIDLTGPFEVLSRIPNSTYRIYGKTTNAVRDLRGLRLS